MHSSDLCVGSDSTIAHDGGSLLRADGRIKFRRLHLRRPHLPVPFICSRTWLHSKRSTGAAVRTFPMTPARRDAATSTAAPIGSIPSIVLHLHPRRHGHLFLFRIISNRLRPECLRERTLKAIRLAINRPPGRPSMYVRAIRSGATSVLLPSQSLKRFAPELFRSLRAGQHKSD